MEASTSGKAGLRSWINRAYRRLSRSQTESNGGQGIQVQKVEDAGQVAQMAKVEEMNLGISKSEAEAVLAAEKGLQAGSTDNSQSKKEVSPAPDRDGIESKRPAGEIAVRREIARDNLTPAKAPEQGKADPSRSIPTANAHPTPPREISGGTRNQGLEDRKAVGPQTRTDTHGRQPEKTASPQPQSVSQKSNLQASSDGRSFRPSGVSQADSQKGMSHQTKNEAVSQTRGNPVVASQLRTASRQETAALGQRLRAGGMREGKAANSAPRLGVGGGGSTKGTDKAESQKTEVKPAEPKVTKVGESRFRGRQTDQQLSREAAVRDVKQRGERNIRHEQVKAQSPANQAPSRPPLQQPQKPTTIARPAPAGKGR